MVVYVDYWDGSLCGMEAEVVEAAVCNPVVSGGGSHPYLVFALVAQW